MFRVHLTTFIFLFVTSICYSQQVIIKINPFDCVNCSFVVPRIIAKYPTSQIVVQEKYKKSNKDIIRKLGAEEFKGNILFSDTIYNSVSTDENLSEIAVFSITGIVQFRDDIKKVRMSSIDYFFADNSQVQNSNLCDDNIPMYCMITTYNDFMLIRNIMTSDLQYSKNGESMKDISLNNEEIVDRIYNEILEEPDALKIFKKFKELPNVKPQLFAFLPIHDKEWYGLYKVGYIAIENNHDTMFKSVLMLLHHNKSDELEIYNIIPPNDYYVLSVSLHIWKNKLYVRVLKNISSREEMPYILGYIDVNDLNSTRKNVSIHSIETYKVPQYIYDFEINNSLPSIISSDKFITYQLTNVIYNVETDELIDIPTIDKRYLDNISFKESNKFSYVNRDMKYISKSNTICLLFEHNNRLYYTQFKPNGKIMKEPTQLLEENFWDNTKTVFLSNDGGYFYYLNQDDNCINMIKL